MAPATAPDAAAEPYHSVSLVKPRFYHLFANCSQGRLITDENRRQGTGTDRQLCGICKTIAQSLGITV